MSTPLTSAATTEKDQRLLDVEDLVVEYPGRGFRGKPFRALKGVSIDIRPGETVGLVGESGSGKTTIGRAVLGLAPLTVRKVAKSEAAQRVRGLVEQVHLPANAAHRLPREFSGGQRQRVAIARALAMNPKLIVCDEPVSALDLSTQARVLALFLEIQERTGVAYFFISHDLDVVRHLSHRVAVMYRGEIVERGDGHQVTTRPQHPYTQKLFLASPVPDPARQAERRAQRQLPAASQREQVGAGA